MPTIFSSSIVRCPRLLLVHPHVELERLADLPVDRQHRVERGHRVLEDHRDVVATNRPDLIVGQLEDVSAWNMISPATILPGGLGMSRMIESPVMLLPQPDSPTTPERLAGHHIERDVVNGFDDAILREELGLESLTSSSGWPCPLGEGWAPLCCSARGCATILAPLSRPAPACSKPASAAVPPPISRLATVTDLSSSRPTDLRSGRTPILP